MQSFGDLFSNNRLLVAGVLLAALAILLAVGIVLFRLVFGRRLHMAGGRTRQPRLGVVDAFDLDRQRQLVLIRRDNVEHLLLIGGPNDVMIEAAIVRAPAVLNAREKENGTTTPVGIPVPAPTAPVMPMAASASAAPPPPEPPPIRQPEPVSAAPIIETRIEPEPAPPPMVSPQPAAAPPEPFVAEPRLPTASTLPAAARGLPASSAQRAPSVMPPRPPIGPTTRNGSPAPIRPAFSRATPQSTAVQQSGRTEPSANQASPISDPAKDSTDRGAASNEPAGASPVVSPMGDDVAVSATPATGVTPVVPSASPTAPPRPVTPLPPRPVTARPATPPQGRANIPTLGSLEEEMAKLLGRPIPPPDQPGS